MTNETAKREIESLDYYLQKHTDDYSEESHTAMMMAIKALEQENILEKMKAEIFEEILSHSGTGEEVMQAYANGLKEGFLKGYDYGVKDWFEKRTKSQTCIEDYPTCTECEHYDKEKHYCPRFCQVIKDTLAEAQPCEDCVSRTEVKNGMIKYGFLAPDMTVTEFVEDCLPSVTPQRPKGKWIIVDDCEHFIAKCSECGEIVDSRMINNYPYCHCGAEMNGGGEDADSN